MRGVHLRGACIIERFRVLRALKANATVRRIPSRNDEMATTNPPPSKKGTNDQRDALVSERRDLQAQLDELEEQTFATNQSDLTGEMGFDEEYAGAGPA